MDYINPVSSQKFSFNTEECLGFGAMLAVKYECRVKTSLNLLRIQAEKEKIARQPVKRNGKWWEKKGDKYRVQRKERGDGRVWTRVRTAISPPLSGFGRGIT